MSYSSLHWLEIRTYRIVMLLEGVSAARLHKEIESVIGARSARGCLRGALDEWAWYFAVDGTSV